MHTKGCIGWGGDECSTNSGFLFFLKSRSLSISLWVIYHPYLGQASSSRITAMPTGLIGVEYLLLINFHPLQNPIQ